MCKGLERLLIDSWLKNNEPVKCESFNDVNKLDGQSGLTRSDSYIIL